MTRTLTPRELFEAVGLVPCGPALWREKVSEKRPGVYVVARVSWADKVGAPIKAEDVLGEEHAAHRKLWLPDQVVVYVGKTKRPLRRRVGEFYRQKWGRSAPHRGGQNVLLLACPLWVYWATTADPEAAETDMIRYFKERVGVWPFGNRRD
jgi:hypothetical protein